mmetsp:Transcript_15589/g.24241  ORF Transcript_15589/g.24241 Transcript_15589/m.24241 type:complete len:129 (-) Transcript_15589:261-647(-)|eukprot:CAMPEP_0196808584 /NCGR_PEP_ID=MMETSP1362-20130617/8574_1 /TAXON_ID=163516 /ORGANISM="Leptocylindrus danicus, Strain CCMP1856" /LENGTH=128 /DNA_ID=CAMNT_0042182981 /DNA_START=53 /DNA_END=439 /DNA_ORIENTATION=-
MKNTFLLFIPAVAAFGVVPSTTRINAVSTTKLGGWMDAFKNDESLGKPQNAGLTNGPRTNDNVTVNGKPVKAVVGQKVAVVAATARAKISYDCRNGDCGTCMVNINGRKVKACQQVIPPGKCAINTLN